MTETIGWAATAVFTASYFFHRPSALRRIQAAAACLWIAYGLAVKSKPVIAANLLVAAAAVASNRRGRTPTHGAPPVSPGSA